MAYSTLIQEEAVTSEFLAVLKPARTVTSWTSVSGNVYSNNFTYGYVSSVTIDGTSQTLVTSSSLSSGEYYWDNENSLLYIYSSSPSSDYIVVTYELYYGTKGAHFPRIPTSAKSSTNIDVYYDPVIINSPSFKGSLTDSLLGYLPSQSSSIVIGNPESDLERHLYDSSFNQKTIDVYHWLGSLETANINKLISGKMQNVRYQTDRVTISILDRVDTFEKEYRNQNNSFYNTTDFADVDPNKVGRPIRYVYGVVNNVFLTNIDYNITAPSVSNNRDWAVREGSQSTFSATVSASPSSTVTRTYIDDATGVSIGDLVYINKATDEYVLVTNVVYTGDNYIDHSTLASGAASSGDSVSRGTLGNLYVIQGGTSYPLYFNRDYTESVSNNVVTISLNGSAESNAGINTFDGTEQLYGKIYGEQNSVTKGGVSFGSDSSTYDCLTNPAVILFDLLKKSGISESDINLTSFDTLNSQISSEEIGFALPQNETQNFPTFKTILTDIFQTNLVQLFINTSGKWEVDYLKVLPSADVSIDNTEILLNTINYDIDYTDVISNVIVGYGYKESSQAYTTTSATSNVAKHLHGIEKQKTFNTLLINSTDAETLATRLVDIFGDRRGTLSFSCKNKFYDNFISDTISVSLEKHVGFAYSKGTENTRSYEIIEIDKNQNTVRIKCNDQRGIQQNSGDF